VDGNRPIKSLAYSAPDSCGQEVTITPRRGRNILSGWPVIFTDFLL
jgi:hypothetical protein